MVYIKIAVRGMKKKTTMQHGHREREVKGERKVSGRGQAWKFFKHCYELVHPCLKLPLPHVHLMDHCPHLMDHCPQFRKVVESILQSFSVSIIEECEVSHKYTYAMEVRARATCTRHALYTDIQLKYMPHRISGLLVFTLCIINTKSSACLTHIYKSSRTCVHSASHTCNYPGLLLNTKFKFACLSG